MANGFDPVMTGFEQPSYMTPAGQRAAYVARTPGAAPRGARYTPTGVGVGAGAGQVGFPAGPPAGGAGQPGQIGTAVLGGLSALGIAIPEPITTALGLAGAAYLGAQAFGLGEGEGIFGIDLFGGDNQRIPGTPIELGGPGLAEPGPGTGWMLLKEWHVRHDDFRLQYYLVQKIGSVGKYSNRWIAMYNTKTGAWKAWRFKPPQLAVIGKNMPRHQMLTRLRKNLSRHKTDAKTVLRYTDPLAYYKQLGYSVFKRKRK